MAAPKNNDFAVKFKTSAQRKKLLKDYVQHAKDGYSDECFPPCDMQTFRKYIQKFPEDFDTDLIVEARRERQLYWERMGNKGSNGGIKGFNAMSWKFNMQNRFSWRDKSEVEQKTAVTYDDVEQRKKAKYRKEAEARAKKEEW